MKVLYLEDNSVDADLTIRQIKTIASDISFDVVPTMREAKALIWASADPGDDADETRPRQRHDVLLTDLGLPDGSGMELIAEIRAADLPLPIVVVTGSGDDAVAVNALKAGADDYVAKRGSYIRRLPATLRSALEHFNAQAARRKKPLRVLYAEHSQADVELARHYLARFGPRIRLDVVNSADALFERLTDGNSPPDHDVVLLDYQLPGMNGLEALKEIRQVKMLETPVLIVTSQGNEDVALQALKLGANDYLVKSDEFFRHLPVALENSFLHAELEREDIALRDSEARFRQVTDNIDEVIWLTDTNKTQMLYVSPAYEKIWGRSCEALYAHPLEWSESVHADDRQRVLDAALSEQIRGNYNVEYRVVRPDGTLRYIHDRAFPIHDSSGKIYRIAGVAQDVTARREQERQIQYLAYHDALSGLPNRALVLDRAEKAIAQAQRHGQMLAVLLLDLDRFKTINDTLGHTAGDFLLRQVSNRLAAALGDEDTVGRAGGDEFLILLPSLQSVEDAARIAEKLLRSLIAPFPVAGQDLHITASIGVSLYPKDADKVETLVKYADTSLYLAKEHGRNTFRFFSPELDARVRARLLMESDLRRAVEQDELILEYQPQLALMDGTIAGVEALVRWRHREGIIPPKEFIPVAEETGLIVPMGEWILRSACTQARAWQKAGIPDLRVSVNLSGRQLERMGLINAIERILAETDCHPRLLELEITESSVMNRPEQAIATLEALHDMGVQLAIDDFGTGYSSLAYLKRFPLDRLKIDASFVAGIPYDGDDLAIVQAMLAMARQLRLKVVAEGVESDSQQQCLKEFGCDVIQGYLFSKPVSADKIGALFSSIEYFS